MQNNKQMQKVRKACFKHESPSFEHLHPPFPSKQASQNMKRKIPYLLPPQIVKQLVAPIRLSVSSTITPRRGSWPCTLNCNTGVVVRFVYNNTSLNYRTETDNTITKSLNFTWQEKLQNVYNGAKQGKFNTILTFSYKHVILRDQFCHQCLNFNSVCIQCIT